ncbi:MAG: FAD:protein FMN transferase [Candidatus Margulisiibacteriota bacterium]
MKIRPLYLLLIFLLGLIAFEYTYTNLIFSAERKAYLMGTPVRVRVNGPNSPHLARRALWEIRKIDKTFSRFNPKSEISTINKLAGLAPLQASKDTFECIQLAARISKLSQGAFDITLGHPKELIINSNSRKIYLRKKGIEIDLGGIGKGYAAEAARKLLLKKGAKSGMIDLRSSIAVFGSKTWKVGIQHSRDKDKLIGIVELGNGQSLATSGDYERGKHIIDPRTGKPAQGCQGVTVIGKNAAETDALSTAVFVLGPRQGMKLIESLPGMEALVIDRNGKTIKSSGLALARP